MGRRCGLSPGMVLVVSGIDIRAPAVGDHLTPLLGESRTPGARSAGALDPMRSFTKRARPVYYEGKSFSETTDTPNGRLHMHRDSEEMIALRLLAGGPKQATYENGKIVFEEGTEVSQRVMGYLCSAEPPLVTGTLRWAPHDAGVVGYMYEITTAGRKVLEEH